MYDSRADLDRNRLYVTLAGRITAEESKQAAKQVVQDIAQLAPGFDVITDISRFEPVTRKETELLLKVHKELVRRGVNRIVRVIGDNLRATVGKIQFERASRETDISAQYCQSVAEADQYLDG